jgi:hypothetical protein
LRFRLSRLKKRSSSFDMFLCLRGYILVNIYIYMYVCTLCVTYEASSISLFVFSRWLSDVAIFAFTSRHVVAGVSPETM